MNKLDKTKTENKRKENVNLIKFNNFVLFTQVQGQSNRCGWIQATKQIYFNQQSTHFIMLVIFKSNIKGTSTTLMKKALRFPTIAVILQ
jgi:hypothetical protein